MNGDWRDCLRNEKGIGAEMRPVPGIVTGGASVS